MNDLDKYYPKDESAAKVIKPELPDLSTYGYQVFEELASHADGQRITYVAHDLNCDRLVAIKEWRILNDKSPSLDYATHLPQIERLKQLDYPNIPHYLNSFATPTGFCLVREYQQGVSLAELKTLPPSDIKLIARAVLKIIAHLQQLHPIVIHQNIKPENIIVDTQDRLTVYLVDFGLQSSKDSAAFSNMPGFTPPEQFLTGQLTSASDIYSLGVTLICLLTGTATPEAEKLLDKNYCPQFQHLIPAKTHPQLVKWLTKMVEPNYQRRYLDAASARSHLSNLSTERAKLNNVVNFSPSKKGEWLRWGLIAVGFIGLALIAREFVFPDTGEISTADITRNQAISKQAAFDESDRGKLIKQKQCVNCNLKYQDFSKAELSGATLDQSSLINSNFSSANLSLAIFRDADLSQANFTKANLTKAAFYGAKLLGTDLGSANLSQAKLIYAKLKGASLRNANLTNADLKFAELQQVDLTSTNLTNADLSNADLSYTNLRKAILTGAKLTGTNLTGATMPDGSMHP